MAPIGFAVLAASAASLASGCWLAGRIGRSRISSFVRVAVVIAICLPFTAMAFIFPYAYTMMVDGAPIGRDDIHVVVAVSSLIVVPALVFGFGMHSILTHRNSSIRPGGSMLRGMIRGRADQADVQKIESAFRWGAFGWVVAMPLTVGYGGTPRAGPVLTVLLPAICATALVLVRLRTGIKKTDGEILDYRETARLNPPPAQLRRELKANGTLIDPCPVERRLEEERAASTFNMQVMVATNLIAVILSLGSDKPVKAWGIIGLMFGASIFLGMTSPKIEHWRTSRRTGAPIWEKEHVDDESTSKGHFYVETTAEKEGDIVALKLLRAATIAFLQVGLIMGYAGATS